MHTIATALLAVFLAVAAHPAQAVDVAAVRTTDGLSADWRNTIGANQSATAGWAFRVGPEAVQVQALGLYDVANGLKNAHPIGLWTAGGTLLAQATLPAGTASLRIGSYRYVAITPVTLNPGQTYVVGAYFGPVADQCGTACGDVMLYRGNETYDPRISFVQSRQTLSVAGAGTLAYPGVNAGIDEGFFGPNFLLAADLTPDPFAFAAQTGVVPGSVATSNAITVSGIDNPVDISVAGGSYAINAGAYTAAAGTVTRGDTVTVRLTAAAAFATAATATLTIGGVSGDFVVTTAAADTVPDPFAFVAQSGVAPNTLATSNAITVSGIDSASPVSVAGGAYSINGAAYTSAAGSVSNGDTVSVQLLSAAGFAAHAQATLTIGGVSGSFDVVTRGAPPAQPVPLLGRGAVALLVAMLALVGLGALRRPRRR